MKKASYRAPLAGAGVQTGSSSKDRLPELSRGPAPRATEAPLALGLVPLLPSASTTTSWLPQPRPSQDQCQETILAGRSWYQLSTSFRGLDTHPREDQGFVVVQETQ